MKFLLSLLLIFIQSYLWSADIGYKQVLKDRLANQAQDVFYLYDISSTPKERAYFLSYEQNELDEFLRAFFGHYYDGHNTLIDEYIDFFTNQPLQHLQIWFGLFDVLERQFGAENNLESNLFKALFLSQTYLLPHVNNREDNNPFLLNAPIAQYYGLKVTDYIDERFDFDKNALALRTYLADLTPKFSRGSYQIAALVLGANTIKKVEINEPFLSSYWELYPFVNSPQRDFYPAMLAAAFLWNRRKQNGLIGYGFIPRWGQTNVVLNDSVHIDQLSAVLSIEKNVLGFMNAQCIKNIIPSGFPIVLPSESKEKFLLVRDSICNFNRDHYFSKTSDSCYVFYRTNKGDYFRDLTRWFGPGLEEIKQLNGFSSNTLPSGWDVFFKVLCADSAEYAAFDRMSRTQKDAAAKGEPIPTEPTQVQRVETISAPASTSGNKTTYIVKSGDSLWAIGQKYNVSDTDIMKWNNIGTNIKPGQKLIIYLP